MRVLMLVVKLLMPCPMLSVKILVPFFMRSVQLPVQPTMLSFCHRALMPSLMYLV